MTGSGDRTSKGELQELLAQLVRALKSRIGSEDCTAADLNVARALLRDNAVDLRGDESREELLKALPNPEDLANEDFGGLQ